MMVPLNLRIYCYPRGHSLFLSPHPSLSDLCQGHGTSAHGLQGDGHDQECHHDAHHVHVPDSQLPLKGEDWNEEFRRWEIWNLKKLFRFFCFSCQNTFLLRHWVLSRAGWRWQCSRPPWTGWTWYTARPARCPSCFILWFGAQQVLQKLFIEWKCLIILTLMKNLQVMFEKSQRKTKAGKTRF